MNRKQKKIKRQRATQHTKRQAKVVPVHDPLKTDLDESHFVEQDWHTDESGKSAVHLILIVLVLAVVVVAGVLAMLLGS